MFPSALWEKGTTTWHSDTSIALRTSKAVITTHAIAALPSPSASTKPTLTRLHHRVGERAEPQISTREIENPIPLVTLPHDPTPFEDALKLLEEYPEEKPAYLRLNVLTKGYLPPDCNEKASNAAKGKACKYCYIKTTRERQADTDESKPISIQEMQEMSPLEIARLYYRETEGKEMDPELCQLMETVMQKVKSKNNS